MSARERILFLAAMAAACAAIAGCGADTPVRPRGEGSGTRISRDVFVVDEDSGLLLVDADDSLLVYDVQDTIPAIPPGTILVGTEGAGYIRRVRSVTVDGRRLFVRATPSYLAEAVLEGTLDATASIGFSGSEAGARGAADRGEVVAAARGVSVSGGGLDLSNVVLYAEDSSGASSTVTIVSGRIEFEPSVDLSLRVADYKLQRFRAGAEGDLRLVCDVKIEASGRLRQSRRTPIAAVKKTIIRHIGSVPVVEVVTMSFVAGFDVSSDSAFTSEMGMEITGSLRSGMQLEGGAWSRTLDASPAFAPRPFLFDGLKDARVEFTIEPRVTVELYGLRSVDLAFGPAFGFVERDEGFPVLVWELFASYVGGAAFERGAIDRWTPPHESERVRCCGATLASGPFRTDRYIFVRQWEIEGASGGVFSYPRGIAVDAAGDLYVTEAWNGLVWKFAADGTLLARWGGAGTGDGQLDTPEKIAVDEDGYVYVVDGGNNRVQKFTSSGSFVLKWGSEGTEDGRFRSPVGVAAAGGAVYVTDGRNSRVQKFSTTGEFLGAWGEYGAGPGQFNGPMGIAVDPTDGSVLVADCQNHRMQRFSAEGALLAAWGAYGQGDGMFDCAIDVTAAPGGSVFAADLGNDRFVQFTAAGAFMTKLGTRGSGEGEFDHPEGAAVNAAGDVYVVDSRNRRIQMFAPRIR